jgi:hypothetical protein
LKVSDKKVSDKKVSDMKVKVSGRKLKFPFFCKFFGKNEFLPKVSETLTFSDFYRDSQSKPATNITRLSTMMMMKTVNAAALLLMSTAVQDSYGWASPNHDSVIHCKHQHPPLWSSVHTTSFKDDMKRAVTSVAIAATLVATPLMMHAPPAHALSKQDVEEIVNKSIDIQNNKFEMLNNKIEMLNNKFEMLNNKIDAQANSYFWVPIISGATSTAIALAGTQTMNKGIKKDIAELKEKQSAETKKSAQDGVLTGAAMVVLFSLVPIILQVLSINFTCDTSTR